MTFLLKGRAVVGGRVKGEALVSRTPFSFFLGVNTDTGDIIDEGHVLLGQSIAGKVLVYPYGKGSSGDCLRLWRCANNGVAPIAIIVLKPDPVHVQGAIIANIPMVCELDGDPMEHIKTGDHVQVDGGDVTIILNE
ncbi:aconitase X swivel domain-containing protein [Chloroflexota bacterium]